MLQISKHKGSLGTHVTSARHQIICLPHTHCQNICLLYVGKLYIPDNVKVPALYTIPLEQRFPNCVPRYTNRCFVTKSRKQKNIDFITFEFSIFGHILRYCSYKNFIRTFIWLVTEFLCADCYFLSEGSRNNRVPYIFTKVQSNLITN